MKKASTQQEILLMTGTRFSSRQCCLTEEKEEGASYSESEQLERACWNGLLPEMLPEICVSSNEGEEFYLWDVKEAASFLSLELGAIPQPVEKEFSIDPYTFLSVQHMS